MIDAAVDQSGQARTFAPVTSIATMASRLGQIAGIVLFAAPLTWAMDPNGRWSLHVDATRRNVGSIWRGEALAR